MVTEQERSCKERREEEQGEDDKGNRGDWCVSPPSVKTQGEEGGEVPWEEKGTRRGRITENFPLGKPPAGKEERPQHSYKEKDCKEGVEHNHPLTHSYGQYNGQDKALAGNMQ